MALASGAAAQQPEAPPPQKVSKRQPPPAQAQAEPAQQPQLANASQQTPEPPTTVQTPGEPAQPAPEMSLEELLEINVSTATKTDRAVSEVPAMMEVITANQIRQRGYRHLGDVLQDIVN